MNTVAVTLLTVLGCHPGKVVPPVPRDSGEEPVGAITLSPETLEFDVTFVGQVASDEVSVTNVGRVAVDLSAEVTSSHAEAWSLTFDDSAPAAGDAALLTVTLAPTTWGRHDGTVRIVDQVSGEEEILSLVASVQEDTDADGYGSLASGGADCDDANPDVHPGQAETWYDGVDADCAGDSDYDADADGADGRSDCDDQDPNAFPGNPETWYDGVDGDCLGGDDYDADLDGSPVPDDCDDAAAAVNPSAAETWYDGVDADCSGGSDYDADGDGQDSDEHGGTDCDDTAASAYAGAAETWYDGLDGDCLGGDDYDADGDGVQASGYGGTDCNDEDPSIVGPAPETWDGVDNDCDGVVDDVVISALAAGVIHGSRGYALGAVQSLSLGGDLTGDGVDDVVVGTTEASYGYLWVVSGASMVGASGSVLDYASATLEGDGYYYGLGFVQGPQQDVDGDGLDDLLATGEPYYNYAWAWLFEGPVSSGDVYDAKATWSGDSSNDNPRAVAAGDLDGDGAPEIVLGSWYDNYIGSSTYYYSGNLGVFDDAVSGDYDLYDAADQVNGSYTSDYLGYSVVVADWTGDGYADILAGAPGVDVDATDGGAVYLLAGEADLDWPDLVASAALASFPCNVSGASLGQDPLVHPGDLDGDGDLDLVLGSRDAGRAWLFWNDGYSGEMAVSTADAVFEGTAGSFASALVYDTDLDGDGNLDIILGDASSDVAGTDAGAVYLFSFLAEWTGTVGTSAADGALMGLAGSGLGSGLAGGGDADGDGKNDLIAGASASDTGATDGGSVYLVPGR